MKIRKSHIPIVTVIVAVVVLLAVLAFTTLFKKPEPLFKRVPASISAGNRANEEIKPDREFESLLTDNIPAGTLIRFSGNGQVSIIPGAAGKKGVFFTFAVSSNNGEKVHTTVQLKRKKDLINLQKYAGKAYSRSFSRELTLRRGDEIIVDFQGSGAAAVNRPTIYDIIPQEKREYVFVIALDTLRADRVGSSLNGVALTPAIQRFQQDAAVFSNTFAQSNWTLPSFTSFFTGLYEFNHQITRTTSLEKEKPLLMEQIASKFFTVNFNAGLWMEGKFGFSRGVDFFSVMSSPTDSYGGKVLFDEALDFLKENNLPSVFMFLHTYQIHSPYAPPREYLDQVVPGSAYEKLDSFFYQKQFNSGVDENVRVAMEQLYDAEILAFDHFFDRFIAELKALGIYDRSMIVFFSDHGEEFYEHKGWAHCHSLYDEVINVPLFIKFPGNRYKGQEIKTNAGVIDIMPTIMDYHHIDAGTVPVPLDGKSLMPLLTGGKWEREYLYSSTSITWLVKNIPPKFAVIKDNFKLIYNFPYTEGSLGFFSEYGRPPEEEEVRVFDLNEDATEQHPLEENRKRTLMKDFIPLVKQIREVIQAGMKRNRTGNIHMTPQEREKLKSLGYL